MIDFIKVSKIYEKNVKALVDVSLSIEQGEFVFLVGSSGAGKSTFIKMILKEIKPTSGKVIINNKDLSLIKEGIYLITEEVLEWFFRILN